MARKPPLASSYLLPLLCVLLCSAHGAGGQEFTLVTTGEIVNDGGWNYGCGWGDYDNDGFPDLFVVNNESGAKDNFLYHNEGDGTFTKVTTGPLVMDGGSSYGCSWGDYDNDGLLDLFVANYNENNFLYHNEGGGAFTRITTGSIVTDGGSSACPAWGDYDNDGYLDLFVCNRTTRNFLYHNNGDGTFARILSGTIVAEDRNSGACAWADYDGDGYLDIFVTNAGPDYCSLFRNQGDGTFDQITDDPVVSVFESFDCASWGDYDNDGDLDLFTAPGMLPGSAFDVYLFRNNGDGSFIRDTDLPHPAATNAGGGSGMIDYDNDGDLDIYLGGYDGDNFLLANDGSGGFTRVTGGVIVTTGSYSKGTSWADVDHDGDLDLFIAVNNYFGGNNRFFINQGNDNHWFQVRCQGTVANRSGIGVILTLTADIGGHPVTLTRDVSGQTGGGTTSQNSLIAHFGLGDAAAVASLTVSWPSGTVDHYVALAVDQIFTAIEGSGMSCPELEARVGIVGLEAYPNPFTAATTVRYVLPRETAVHLAIYDVEGRLVEALPAGARPAGSGSVTWAPAPGSSGIFYCRIRTATGGRSLPIIRLD